MSALRSILKYRWGVVILLLLAANSVEIHATKYFISPAGDDSFAGDMVNKPWKSIAKVNAAKLSPGDKILFQAGNIFEGNLSVTEEDAGNANSPVVIGSYGEGKARLSAGKGDGIRVLNTAGVMIENLIVEGSGSTNNTSTGILFENLTTNVTRFDGVTVENVEVRGFGKHGVMVTGDHCGFGNIRIEHSSTHDNLRGGIEIAGRLEWSATNYAHSNVVIEDCRSYNNTGDPNYLRSHSGSGIVLYQVDGGIIENCAAWNNGALCPASGGGPVGIWTCSSRGVTIQHCESFANKTRGMDGGGFDIDGGSENCVLQYNYSHDNLGPGLMVYTYPYCNYNDRSNTVRFNISVNDAADRERYAGLWVRADGRKMTGVEIYNNTVITKGAQAACVYGNEVEAVLRNNIFITSSEGTPLNVEGAGRSIRFENNLYWRNGAPFLVKWNGHPYEDLNAWRKASAQELISGKDVGLFLDPRIPSYPPAFSREQPNNFKNLRSYRPENTLVLTNGISFALASNAQDFFSQALRGNCGIPLGAVGSE